MTMPTSTCWVEGGSGMGGMGLGVSGVGNGTRAGSLRNTDQAVVVRRVLRLGRRAGTRAQSRNVSADRAHPRRHGARAARGEGDRPPKKANCPLQSLFAA